MAWYLDLGAAALILYFDDPADPAMKVLEAVEGVVCIPCTPGFWADRGLTSDTRFTKRQNAALTDAYARAATRWFLAVDGDELLHLAQAGLDGFTRDLSDDVRAVRFVTAEAVLRSEGGWDYRTPALDRKAVRRVYGEELGTLLAPRSGLVGHADGKSLTRTGLAISKVRQHWVVGADAQPVTGLTLQPGPDAALLHFFDPGYEGWRAKVEWRASSWGFAGRVSERLSAGEDAAREVQYQGLYERLHRLTPDQRARLEAEGGSLALMVDPDAPARRHFGAHLE